MFQCFACVLRVGSWIRSLVAQFFSEHEQVEGGMGAKEVSYGLRAALARPRRRGLEGTFPAEL